MNPQKRKSPFNPKTFLASAGEGRVVSNYREGEVVFRQGDPADSVLYIQSGKAKLTVLSEQGKEAVVGLVGPGDFFGEGCLAGQPLRTATASALADCVIVRMAKDAIVRAIREE
ncbi:MAG: Crp/Fnr family transcriptional regulator, partial [Xanthobacteraceae bacterium]